MIRVTHANDPVVQVPFKDWGFQHHSVSLALFSMTDIQSEYWINTNSIPVPINNMVLCNGDESQSCLEGQVIQPARFVLILVIQSPCRVRSYVVFPDYGGNLLKDVWNV